MQRLQQARQVMLDSLIPRRLSPRKWRILCLRTLAHLSAVLTQPFNGRYDVVVEHSVLAFTESQPSQIGQATVRYDDCSPQHHRPQLFVKFSLRPRNVYRRRLHLESVIKHFSPPRIADEEQDLILS